MALGDGKPSALHSYERNRFAYSVSETGALHRQQLQTTLSRTKAMKAFSGMGGCNRFARLAMMAKKPAWRLERPPSPTGQTGGLWLDLCSELCESFKPVVGLQSPTGSNRNLFGGRAECVIARLFLVRNVALTLK